jgi:hypothetical protein
MTTPTPKPTTYGAGPYGAGTYGQGQPAPPTGILRIGTQQVSWKVEG